MGRERESIRIVVGVAETSHTELNAGNEPLRNPLPGLEIEFPFRTLPGPAARGLNVLEEAGTVGTVASDAGRGERVVWRRREEMRLPFGGGGLQGAVLKFEYLDFAGFGGRVEGYGREVRQYGAGSAWRGGDGNVEERKVGSLVLGGWGGFARGFGKLLLLGEPSLRGGVAGDDEGGAANEEEGAPGEGVCDYEERGGEECEVQEDGGGEDLIGEVGERCNCLDYDIVDEGEVSHAVLEVAHVAEKVLGRFGGWSDRLRRGDGRTLVAVIRGRGGGGGRLRRRRVASQKGWDHNEEQKNSKWKYDKEVWIETDKHVDA